MTSFSSGRYALMISDRSGQAFPWKEMVREWNGAWVHFSEYEPKQPQLQPRPTSADPQALTHARPSRTALPTPAPLDTVPFSTAGTTTLTVNEIDTKEKLEMQSDFIRLRTLLVEYRLLH